MVTMARSFRAVFSYRVATLRNCLSLEKQHSIRCLWAQRCRSGGYLWARRVVWNDGDCFLLRNRLAQAVAVMGGVGQGPDLQPPFCTGGVLMGADGRAVHNQVFKVGVIRHRREYPPPDALAAPPAATAEHAVPGPEQLGPAAPRRTRPHDPQNRLDGHMRLARPLLPRVRSSPITCAESRSHRPSANASRSNAPIANLPATRP